MDPGDIAIVVVGAAILMAVFTPFSGIVDDTSGRQTVVDEELTADVGVYQELSGYSLVDGSVDVDRYNATSDSFENVSSNDYEVDLPGGQIKPLASGAIQDGDRLRIDYEYRATSGPTAEILELMPLILAVVVLAIVGSKITGGL
jgi:hypothetical protein